MGVFQGAIGGPILLIIFINDIQVLKVKYADDNSNIAIFIYVYFVYEEHFLYLII